MLPTSNYNFVDHYQLTSPFAFNTSFHTLAFILVFVCRPIYLGQNEIGLRSIFFITASCKPLKTIFLFYLMVYLLTSPPLSHGVFVYKRKIKFRRASINTTLYFACCMYVKWFVNNLLLQNRQDTLELHFRSKRLFGLNLRNYHYSHRPINVSTLAP